MTQHEHESALARTSPECPTRSSPHSRAHGRRRDGPLRRSAGLVAGTRAEKRSERLVALWLLVGGLSGLALLLVFLFWPWSTSPTASRATCFTHGPPRCTASPSACRSWPSASARCSTRSGSSRGDLHPGSPRRGILGGGTQGHGGHPGQRLRNLHDQAPQVDLGVGRHRPRRIRTRFGDRLRRRPHQESVEAGGSHRRRHEGRVVDVGLDAPVQRRDDLPRSRNRSPW